jgi:hypothetical protein
MAKNRSFEAVILTIGAFGVCLAFGQVTHTPVEAAFVTTGGPTTTTSTSGSTGVRTFPTTPPVTEPPPTFNPPVVVPLPPRVNDVRPFQPIDVTHTTEYMNSLGPRVDISDAIIGIAETKGFPNPTNLKGPSDFILVKPESTQDVFRQETPYFVVLEKGTFLASVRKPSQTGMLHTKFAEVAYSSPSDSFVVTDDHSTRIRNTDGMGQALKIKINEGPGAGTAFTLAPGYEVVVADHKLSRLETRPNDGILRRGTHVLEGGHAAISEYNVESMLQSSALVKNMTTDNDAKTKRILGDMSRMAAVLNQLNGTQGFSAN